MKDFAQGIAGYTTAIIGDYRGIGRESSGIVKWTV
jgi:hypothetical protein